LELRFRPLVAAAQTTLELRGGAAQTANGVFALPDQFASVRLDIYDILGQRVRVLMDEVQVAGRYQVRWDGRNAMGHGQWRVFLSLAGGWF
jgi:flagellar hook assembly protein FlgD